MLQVIDMRDSADYSMKQADFFKAFRASGGKVQDSEELVMLKVKDYPPDAEFADVMPRHWQVCAHNSYVSSHIWVVQRLKLYL